MSQTPYKKDFIDFLIQSEALLFGEFTTKSGRQSPYFINTGMFRSGSQIKRLGEFYAKNIIDNIKLGHIDKDIKFIFGPAYKGIPLVIATSIALCEYGIDIKYCFNRKEAKDHGEGGNLVGYIPNPEDKCLIIEDVITAGTAVRQVLPTLKDLDVNINGLIIAVDRMEKSQDGITAIQSIYENEGIPTYPVIDLNDIINNVKLPEETEKRLREYRKEYCE